MSPAAAARGKVRRAARRGETIPLGYALDKQGRPTTDPNVALDGGVMQPIGGPKGSGISMLMDILGGVITGAGYAGDVGNQFLDYERPQNVGHFFLAMKPDLFVSKDEYFKSMDRLVQRVHACPTAEGFSEVIMPGERERRFEAKHRRTGVPYSIKEVTGLQEEAAKAGLPPLPLSDIATCSGRAMKVGDYDIDIVVQGFPGKSVCHGGLGWSTVALLRAHGRIRADRHRWIQHAHDADQAFVRARCEAGRYHRPAADAFAPRPFGQLDAVLEGTHRDRRA